MKLGLSKSKGKELMVFAKTPIAGSVKTRLIPAVGPENAAKIHKELVQRTLESTSDTSWLTTLWCSPHQGDPFFQDLSRKHDLLLDQQKGENLGCRMFNAFQSTLKRNKNVVIMGTDCPVMNKQTVRQVFNALAGNYDAVIVPAEDGGYVLLGLTRVDFALFSDIPWGTDTVYAETLAQLKHLNFNYLVLPTLWDVDRPEDLERYQKLKDAS